MIQEKTDTKFKENIDVKEPSKYAVRLHNDDVTTFEFVNTVLIEIFHKSLAEACEITKMVHDTGIGVAGIYDKQISEQKVCDTLGAAQRFGYPMVCDAVKM